MSNHSHEHSHEHGHENGHKHSHEHSHEHGHEHIVAHGVEVSLLRHDDFWVASCSLEFSHDSRDAVLSALERVLAGIAQCVEDAGGVVGHIKASVTVAATETVSVTEAGVPPRVTAAAATDFSVNIAAIAGNMDGALLAERTCEAVAAHLPYPGASRTTAFPSLAAPDTQNS